MKFLDHLKDNKLFTPILIWYEGLPPDQKKSANLAFIGGIVLIMLFFIYLGNQKVSSLKEEAETKSETLKELKRFEEKMNEQTQILKQLERRAKQISGDFSLLSSLEQLAQTSNIGRESIESIRPQQLPPGDYFTETEATVQLVKVTLKQLTDYFYKIETSPNFMTLKELRVKPRFDNPQFLNVTFKVSSYKPKD